MNARMLGNRLKDSEMVLVACRIEAGEVVGYPTETVWGLAAAPQHIGQVQRRKGRDAEKPLQVSCPDLATAFSLAEEHPLLPLLSLFWPGPLTVIAPASPACPEALAPGGLVGLRLPAHRVAQELLSACGPLATTSLNPAGQPPALTFEQAKGYGLADLLLGTPQDTAGGLASTVVQLGGPEEDVLQLVRVGALPTQELRRVLEPLGVRLIGLSDG